MLGSGGDEVLLEAEEDDGGAIAAASELNVEVQHDAHDASTVMPFTPTAAVARSTTSMDHGCYDEKKEEHPSIIVPSPQRKLFDDQPSSTPPMISYSLQNEMNNNSNNHLAYSTSLLSNASMDDEEEDDGDDDDDDDDMLNFLNHHNAANAAPPTSTTTDASPAARCHKIIMNSTSSSSPYRIPLNTYNSILSITEDEDEQQEGETTSPTCAADEQQQPQPDDDARVADKSTVLLQLHVPVPRYYRQPSPSSSCLLDIDVDDDDDDDEEEEEGDDDDNDNSILDGSPASFDDPSQLTNGHVVSEHASTEDGADRTTCDISYAPLSSTVETETSANSGRSSPPLVATEPANTSTTTAAPTNNNTSCMTTSSCPAPRTPPICTRSWCGGTTAADSTAVMLVTSPILDTSPSIPIPTSTQLPSAPLQPQYPTTTTTTGTRSTPSTTVLMKSPRGGRGGFFDSMTEHFVDSLCFRRDSSSTATTTTTTLQPRRTSSTGSSSSSNVEAPIAAATTTTTTTTTCSTPKDDNDDAIVPAPEEQQQGDNAMIASTAPPSPCSDAAAAAVDTAATTDSVVDGRQICSSSAICGSGMLWTSPLFGSSGDNADQERSLCLHDDIMELLGCARSPNDDEMQKVWAWNQSILECHRKRPNGDDDSGDDSSLFHPRQNNMSFWGYNLTQQIQQGDMHYHDRRRPRRRELHERALRVHQLRTERGMPCYKTRPFWGRTQQRLVSPSVPTKSSTAATSPTSVTTRQMDGPPSPGQPQTHYDNLTMMMNDSTLSALPLRRSSRSMDDRILQQECKRDPLRKSKLEEDLNRRIGIGKHSKSHSHAGSFAHVHYPEDDDMGYDSDPGGIDIYPTTSARPATSSSASAAPPPASTEPLQPRMGPTIGVITSSSASTTSSSSSSLLGHRSPPPPHTPLWDVNVMETVQESLNMSWNLTWHPGKNAANGNNSNSRKIRIWIERGTIINSAKVMLEPTLMWRDVYQPEMSKQRKLNVCLPNSSPTKASTTATSTSPMKPCTIRLLSICRVLEAPLHDELDRELYPLARPSCSLLLRTAAPDGKEYLFEAATTAERDAIAQRWKVCIARFAALAVMEDLDAICREFFVPAITSRTLVPDDSHFR